MRRKSNRRANDILIALAAALAAGAFAAMLGMQPWVVVLLVVIVLIGAWAVAVNGISGSP